MATHCLPLSTWPGDIAVDPFCESTMTLIKEKQFGRCSLGFENGERCWELAVAWDGQSVLEPVA
jgi:hypothetical protein